MAVLALAFELALGLLELPDEPQPAATSATIRLLAATPAAPRIRLRAGVNRNMTVVLLLVGVGFTEIWVSYDW